MSNFIEKEISKIYLENSNSQLAGQELNYQLISKRKLDEQFISTEHTEESCQSHNINIKDTTHNFAAIKECGI